MRSVPVYSRNGDGSLIRIADSVETLPLKCRITIVRNNGQDRYTAWLDQVQQRAAYVVLSVNRLHGVPLIFKGSLWSELMRQVLSGRHLIGPLD